MATDRRKSKRKPALKDELEKPTKEEYAVAKYLRFNAPSKEGKFRGNSVFYFSGAKIVDAMLDSKWGSKNCKSTPLFTSRSSCTYYCERLLEKGFFHRAEKLEKKDKKAIISSTGKEDPVTGVIKRNKSKKDLKQAVCEGGDSLKKDLDVKKEIAETDVKVQNDEKIDESKKDDSSAEEKKKKRKKPKLHLHDNQMFIDGLEQIYIWIYDPVPLKTFIIGLLLVIGAIILCLIPLWPPEMKVGIYYLSLATAGFVGFILSLCIVRMIIFVVVMVFTFGKVSLWVLPNLTEDVSFVESFKPLYQLKTSKSSDQEKTIKDKSEKDEEEEDNVDELNETNKENKKTKIKIDNKLDKNILDETSKIIKMGKHKNDNSDNDDVEDNDDEQREEVEVSEAEDEEGEIDESNDDCNDENINNQDANNSGASTSSGQSYELIGTDEEGEKKILNQDFNSEIGMQNVDGKNTTSQNDKIILGIDCDEGGKGSVRERAGENSLKNIESTVKSKKKRKNGDIIDSKKGV